MQLDPISVSAHVPCGPQQAWTFWTTPEHIICWNAASDDWHCPRAENDPVPGGRFSYRMEARDGTHGFDFSGTYETVQPPQQLDYTMEDGRRCRISFQATEAGTLITETFDPEDMNPRELQEMGWQMILNRYAAHVATQMAAPPTSAE